MLEASPSEPISQPGAPVRTARRRPNPPVDVAFAPLAVGLAAAWFVPAAASGASVGRALAALALGALAALAFARDPFAADRLVRRGLALLALAAIWMLVSRGWALSPAGSMVEGARMATFVLLAYAAHVAFVRESSRVARGEPPHR